MLKVVKVRGMSMHPTFAPGDYLILTKARLQTKHLQSGFVVLVDHPKYGVIVKRLKSVGDKTVRLMGDGAESIDSADMGDVPISHIRGRARLAITPNGVKRL